MRPHRLSLLLFLGLVGSCAVLAAPAPPPRPWVDGWKVVDPEKTSTFERTGDVLTITVPATKEETAPFHPFTKAPRLLREVSGDFVVEVRLGGSFIPSEKTGKEFFNPGVCAGLVLVGEKDWHVDVIRDSTRIDNEIVTGLYVGFPSTTNTKLMRARKVRLEEWSPDREVYLRLSRSGKDLVAAFSADGKRWQQLKYPDQPLPEKLKLVVHCS